MSALSRPEFHSETAAFAHLEKIIWAGAPVCPHCDRTRDIRQLQPSSRMVRVIFHIIRG